MKATPGFLYSMILIQIDIRYYTYCRYCNENNFIFLPSYFSISLVVWPQVELKFMQIFGQGKVKSGNLTGLDAVKPV